MIMVSTILLVLALIAFVLDTIKFTTKINLTALGLALFVAAALVGRFIV